MIDFPEVPDPNELETLSSKERDKFAQVHRIESGKIAGRRMRIDADLVQMGILIQEDLKVLASSTLSHEVPAKEVDQSTQIFPKPLEIPEKISKEEKVILLMAHKAAELLGIEGAFHFFYQASEKVIERLNSNKSFLTKTFGGELTELTEESAFVQLGLDKIYQALGELDKKATQEILTKTHQIDLGFKKVIPLVAERIPLIGKGVSVLSESLGDFFIARIRAKQEAQEKLDKSKK